MFKINDAKTIITDHPIITDNYQVLHFDEAPILYCGSNRFGNRIIGSLVEDDDENKVSRHFRVIVDAKTFYSFITQQTTYLDVLKDSKEIYVLDNNFEGLPINIYHLNLNDIPVEYLPLPEACCPEVVFQPSFFYLIRLIGRLANNNAAIPRVISKIQNKFAELLESTTNQLKNIGFEEAEVHQLAYEAGSFVLNFDVTLNKAEGLFLNDKEVAGYLRNFLEYCMKYLHQEAEIVYGPNPSDATKFTQLLARFEDTYKKTGTNLPEDFSNKVKNDIQKAAEAIAEISEGIGDHFSEMEILNEKIGNNVIGFIDSEYRETIESTIQKIQERTSKVERDVNLKPYEIYIYHLNVRTRSGNAFIYNDVKKTNMSQPKIKISGEEPLEGTKYTRSLHATEWIEVHAKAIKLDGKFRSLEIEFDK